MATNDDAPVIDADRLEVTVTGPAGLSVGRSTGPAPVEVIALVDGLLGQIAGSANLPAREELTRELLALRADLEEGRTPQLSPARRERLVLLANVLEVIVGVGRLLQALRPHLP